MYARYAPIETRPAPLFAVRCHVFMQGPGRLSASACAPLGDIVASGKSDVAIIFARSHFGKGPAMRLIIEIVAAALLVFCISATSAAFAAGSKAGRSADGLGCSFSVPANASPAARCAAIRRQCGGKFYANYCSGKMLSAM
jgi:hypothetical protein